MTRTEFLTNERGAVASIFGFILMGLCMVVGLALISVDMDWSRTATQRALDLAVLAAAVPNDISDPERIAIAERVYAANQIIRPSDGAKIELVKEAPAQFSTTATTVVGAAVVHRKAPFIGLFGRDHVDVSVGAAAIKADGAPICVLGLDPTEAATMDFNGQAAVELKDCASMANSANGAGMHQVGQPNMKAKDIGVNGGYTGSEYDPLPSTGVEPVADPLASLPEPIPGPCGPMSGKKITNETITLQPGTYCGGISLQAGSVVTLDPGIYIMKDGPLNLSGGVAVTGTDVMIAFLGPDATMYAIGNNDITLTSPKSGTYQNIQFFGDRNIYVGTNKKAENLWFSVGGGTKLSYDGALYLPSFHAWFFGSSEIQATSPNYIAIAKKLWFQDQTQVKFELKNRRGLDVGEAKTLHKTARLIR